MRTREIGIRAALGASRRDVMTLVLRGCAFPVLGGLISGTAAATVLAPAAAGLLFGVSPRDMVSLAMGPAALGCGAPLADVVPFPRPASNVTDQGLPPASGCA